MASQQNSFANVATIGIDIGKTTFHLIGQDRRGAIMMRAKLSLPRERTVARCRGLSELYAQSEL